MAATLAIVGGSIAAGPVTAQSEPQPITGATLELAAGTWADSSSGPTIEFTVEDGWFVDAPPLQDVGIALAHSDFVGAYMTITRFDGGVFPEACATEENAAEFYAAAGPTIETSAESLASHLSEHPYLEMSASAPIEVDGRSGVVLDVRSDIAADCDPPWAWLWRLPVVLEFHLADDEDARFIALDVGDGVVVIAMEAFTGPEPDVPLSEPEVPLSEPDTPLVDWDGFLGVAMALVDTMVITPTAR